MAELDFDSYDSGATVGRSANVTHALNLVGAACSVALIVGLGVWGYKLAVRDVNGVPVMRALSGPMRVAPDAPGGDVALHQGLSVNAVAAVGMAASMPDQVLLAPPPVNLTLEDAPGLGQTVVTAAPAPPVVPLDITEVDVAAAPIDPVTLSAPPAETETEIQTATDAAVALALADALAQGIAPFEEPLQTEPSGIAPVKSPRPQPRPVTGAAPQDVQAVSGTVAPAEIDPATLEIGTRLVQLGAFDNAEDAKAEWTLMQARFAELMGTKSMVVQAAQSGGRTFYRLRAHGFVGEDDARRFCAALVAENAPCIPALHR